MEPGRAICYSGFREGQSPESGIFPSYGQIKEDLLILHDHWKYLRLYDCDKHTDIVLEVIQNENLDFKVMLGAYIGAEMNNFGCQWGGFYSEEELAENKARNLDQIKKLIQLANEYPDIIFSLSAGNEALVHWTDHYVPIQDVIKYVRLIKMGTKQPVTFCENYVPWQEKLHELVEEVDFISIHTYPVWEYKNIHEALEYTKQNYYSVADRYPHKPVVITEAGWATNSNGRGIDPHNVSEDLQEVYYKDLMKWTDEEEILTFYFEAFDESWKGSNEPLEPEKHWGLFTVDRKPKKVMQKMELSMV
ncbi:glycosyl hydrolase [Ancylomarina euxinus]|uniref:Endo-1,3-beta-glucanase btgC n=1 Tax=Ancylomarina euxinus TaxID=2283627 RepID=A0A425Y4A5_9BACT|nr:glycosyl hydrolase [Ancylomarina euxinus]RRG23103.1 glycosyl hydrolase [Ancylomarina euxinus]